MIALNPAEVEARRDEGLARLDGRLMFDVGHFITWYSAAELSITGLLAAASGVIDHSTFDTLCMGMDCRMKIGRLRKILKNGRGIGANLDHRLIYIDEKARPIRTSIAQSILSFDETHEGRYYAFSLGALSWEEIAQHGSTGYKPATVVTAAELLGWGKWLELFCADVQETLHSAARTGPFEIEDPKSPMPAASRPGNGDRHSFSRRGRPVIGKIFGEPNGV
jgi:hypothetical protein